MTTFDENSINEVYDSFNEFVDFIIANESITQADYNEIWKALLDGVTKTSRSLSFLDLSYVYEMMSFLSFEIVNSSISEFKVQIGDQLEEYFNLLKSDDMAKANTILNKVKEYIGDLSEKPSVSDHETSDSAAPFFGEQMIKMFVDEAFTVIDELNNEVIRLEDEPHDEELLNTIFRAAHTIKGNAATFGYENIKTLAHRFESVFDLFRKNKLEPTPYIIDVISEGLGEMEVMVRCIDDQVPYEGNLAQIYEKLDDIVSLKLSDTASLSKKSQQEKKEPKKAIVQKISSEDLKKSLAIQNRSLRVDAGKLDQIVTTVGEVNISNNALLSEFKDILSIVKRKKLMSDREIEDIYASIDTFSLKINDLQSSIIRTRMIPLIGVFQKFPKIVRDLSRQTNKEIVFQYSGENIEVDKNIYEEIADPLMHLIRNCVDHGVETPDVREQKGKSKVGSVSINAKLEGSQVIITVQDDGRGLDREKIVQKAIANELITPDKAKTLTDREVYEIIFTPGFSTRDTSTEISGRGVGMDVVRQNLQKLKGVIKIESELKKGTRFVMSLPASLANKDVLVVNEDIHTVAIPVEYIVEVIDVKSSQIQIVENKEVMEYRGHLIPFIYMRNVFGVKSIGSGVIFKVVILKVFDEYCAMVVDQIQRRQQIVMKPLGELLGKIKYINAGSVMGDGSILLILDVFRVFNCLEEISIPVFKPKPKYEGAEPETLADMELDMISNISVGTGKRGFMVISVDYEVDNKKNTGYFALDVSTVSQVADLPELSVIPEQPEHIAGYCKLLDKAIPVYDLPSAIVNQELDVANAKLVVMNVRNNFFGVLCHRIHKMCRIEENEIKDISAMGVAGDNRLISGIVDYDDLDISVIDSEKLFARVVNNLDENSIIKI